ncbi:MAG TPA: PDZ domain-containing protein [Fimbriimonadaceae bacterium]|nr:PDZ domain-containing protein [Fimbriimonadaceae bacterium]
MVVSLLVSSLLAPLDGPLLLRHPTANKTSVVFSFAGDLWTVPRQGGRAARLTTSVGVELDPIFSPDGSQIAFTGQYSGDNNVYVMPAEGGEPKRLTYHPRTDIAVGWTPDSKSVIFVSEDQMTIALPVLFTVPIAGGPPQRLPLPTGTQASFSPDGKRLAYNPGAQWQRAWKRYRGGQTTKVWIADLADSKVKEVPRNNTNDSDPLWVGGKIYFLSDRNGPKTLFSYDTTSGKVAECVPNRGFYFKTATAGPGVIALERVGSIALYDTTTGKLTEVDVEISGEFPEARNQYKDASRNIVTSAISPNGVRALFAARGDIWTVPAAKGDARNLTQTSDACERDPAWSPDGQSIAYLTDATGEYKLVVRDALGKTEGRTYDLQERRFYYGPTWSPDSQKISYTDNQHNLWWLDLKTGKSTLVDQNPFENPLYVLSASWSPDSKWLTYHRDLDNHISAVFLHSLESGKSTQVTDGLSDARNPVFDGGGNYLYFTASTDSGPGAAWLDLSSFRAINSVAGVYCAVLRNDLPSPLAPESDEEKPKVAPKPEDKKPFRIDLEGLDQRILTLPVPAKNYIGLAPGPPESVLLVDLAPLANIVSPPRATLSKFSFAGRTVTPLTSGLSGAAFTPGGDKVLVGWGGAYQIASTAAPFAPGSGMVDLSGMKGLVDPLAEWRQMFHEAIRVQRDFLYAPNYHGVDLAALKARYEPFVKNLRTRADLNYLLEDMLGELCIGHMFIQGGDMPSVAGTPGGLLGADYRLENGRYRFARVYNGENWNPNLRAPLTAPGINVKSGEYLLAINGQDLGATDNVHQRLEMTANKQVTLKVGPSPDGTGARDVVVVPVPDEAGLRLLAWREDNRRTVDKLSGGKLGYMHIPDTNIGGWINFNRYFYAQVGKDGLVVDERFNGGGQVDDFMVDLMARPLRSMWTSRYGKDFPSPLGQIYGPKVMIINQYAGSGGDYFPWHFKKAKVGPVVGKRTWGGLVGILVFPTLIDGGAVTAPNLAFYNPDGTWDVENYGVDPDIDVEFDPALWRQGRDAQLERAVAEAMKLLQTQPKPTIKKPAYPDKTKIK